MLDQPQHLALLARSQRRCAVADQRCQGFALTTDPTHEPQDGQFHRIRTIRDGG